ncbi:MULTISPECIES: hypothetical protein [unclassified Frondihabitans]|uniref:hypothetical protein n=1 Tax=unclassified Frondihabitans TaxID=2626248 RepID=UPI000F4FDD85|nr:MULTISPECIES: hypothetical protein [unclassified Frondihabitans]RPE75200.1 hypothetical protein EDF37_2804 [Frondihabitans sp. PhB153]RPF04442.1 hypothetical protein EDF39_2872 [Frondihabitans sp. PhB161]
MSADVDLRKFVIDSLKPLVPAKWDWYDYTAAFEQLPRTTVRLTLQSIEKMPEAPNSKRLVTYTMTIVDPSDNPSSREGSLDDALVLLLAAIDDTRDFKWSRATQVNADNAYLAYDIDISIPVTRVKTDAKGARP